MKKNDLSDSELDNLLNHFSDSVRSPEGKYTAENSYSQLQNRLYPEKRTRIQLFRYVAAASVAIILMLSAYALLNTTSDVETITVATNDKTEEIVLPDGSHIVLSHYSSLQYPSKFKGEDRTVILSGEAFFDVAKDKDHPFIVHAENVRIKVLGTEFNVQAYVNDAYIKTTLIEGRVAVNSLNNNALTILSPNETALFDKKTNTIHKKTEENTINEIAWKEGKLIFDNKPLAEIVGDLANYFNVRIDINNQQLQTYKMTARFEQNESIEDVLDILQTGANFEWQRKDNTITITPNH